MKTFKNLYRQVYTFDNLYEAARKARKHKRYKLYTLEFDRRLEENLWELHHELKDREYVPGDYTQFKIKRPKERLITSAPYRDRVVHHALCNVIEPIFEKRFIHDSYACRVGKGTHKGVDRCQAFLRRYRFGLRGDISKYFPSIDHNVLFILIERWFKDDNLLRLIDIIIQHYREKEVNPIYFPGDDLLTPLERGKGLPIGNLTSQLFANFFLNELDQFVKTELKFKGYLRYMDDFIVFSDDKRLLHSTKYLINDFLADLRLKLHPKKCEVFAAKNGVPFLGFHVYESYRRVLKANVRDFEKRLIILQKQYYAGSLTFAEITEKVHGWIAHASHADSWHLRSALFNKHTFTRGWIDQRLQPG